MVAALNLPPQVGAVALTIASAAVVDIVCLSVDPAKRLKTVWLNLSITFIARSRVLHPAVHNILVPTLARKLAVVDTLLLSSWNSVNHFTTLVALRHQVITVHPLMPDMISVSKWVLPRTITTNELTKLSPISHRHHYRQRMHLLLHSSLL